MEYANGGDLDHYLKSRRGNLLSEERVLHFFVQISLAIKHIHDRKILHRDLKSQNIFLTNGDMVKLGDFGIARVLRNTAELASTQIGTPYYMSPEIMDNKKYNSKTDIWSLAVILYEIMCLKLPFNGSNIRMLMINIMRSEPAPPPSTYSQGLRELLKSMFSKVPKARPGITSILSSPVVRNQISHILDDAHMRKEFSHTVLHGEHILNDQKPSAEGKPEIIVKDAYKQILPPQNAPPIEVAKPEAAKQAAKPAVNVHSKPPIQIVQKRPNPGQKVAQREELKPSPPISRQGKEKPVVIPSVAVKKPVERDKGRRIASVADKLKAAEENRIKAQNEKLQKLKEQREALQQRNAALQAKPRTPINKVIVTPVKSSLEKRREEEIRKQRLVADNAKAKAIRENVQRRQWSEAVESKIAVCKIQVPASVKSSILAADTEALHNRYKESDSSSSERERECEKEQHAAPPDIAGPDARPLPERKSGENPINSDFFAKLESQLGGIKAQMNQLKLSPRIREVPEPSLTDEPLYDKGKEMCDRDAVTPMKGAAESITSPSAAPMRTSFGCSSPSKRKIRRDSQGFFYS